MGSPAMALAREPVRFRKPQPQPAIEDNALIGDLHTAALVAKDGSIDSPCLPDFDGGTCFASIHPRHAGERALEDRTDASRAFRSATAGTR